MKRTWGRRIAWAIGLVVALSTMAAGQGVRRGEIAGSVKDDTGAALPGVTVTVTSPALQVPQIVRVSDERGEYQVLELPAGAYRVQYDLSGFGTLVREGILLTTGFAARLDVVLKVGTLAETITVSGESPVVDVTATRGGTTLSDELIAAIPSNQNFRDLMLMVGGGQASNAPMVGQLTTSALGHDGGVSYGAGWGKVLVEGVWSMGAASNFTAYEEMDVKTFGNTADVDVSGAAVQLVMKSGGNQFHGRYNEIAQHERFASENIDDRLRTQGVVVGDSVVYYNDLAADLGGRIIRDKLWFYGNARDLRGKIGAIGLSLNPGPDVQYGTSDDVPAYPTATLFDTAVKVSYQATPKNRFISVWQSQDLENPQNYDRFTPLESAVQIATLYREIKPLEWQSTLSNRLLVDLMVGFGERDSQREWQPQHGTTPWVTGAGGVFDRTTQQRSGPAFNSSALNRNITRRKQMSGSVNYLPAGSFLGSHAIQAGYRLWLGSYLYTNPSCECARQAGIGEYEMIFDTVGGVPHQPVEINAKNFPVKGAGHQNLHGAYVMDSWRPTTRLTMNLGLRWERQVYWVPPTEKVQGTFGNSGRFSRVDVNAWNALAPRAGVAFDLSGDGKTVLKATYGWFNHDLEAGNYAFGFSQNSVITYGYRWHDLNGDKYYQPGEVNLDLNGPDFLRVSGASNRITNPNLKLPHTHEASGSVERELGPALSIRGLFVYKRLSDPVTNDFVFTTVNTLRPLNVWDQAFTRRDPGPDGVLATPDDGPLYTIYDYNPAYRGAAFVRNMDVNADPDRYTSFQNIEVMLIKRPTGRWFANTSFLATKNHVWRTSVVTTPNDNIFPVSDYWNLTYLLAGGYNFPFGINVSSLFQAYNGLPRQRTVVFRAADPAGGPRFPSSSTISLPMEPLGATRGPARSIMNLRLGKDFRLGGSRRIMASVDAFNAFNSNVAWGRSVSQTVGVLGIDDVSGPTYGYAYSIVQPRMLRFNLGFEF